MILKKKSLVRRAIEFKKTYVNELAAVIATFGVSLSFALSELFHVLPCELCWYQRIFLYPLPFIFFAAIWLRETRTYVYALPMTIIGGLIALYHTLIQWGAIELTEQCGGLVACDEVPINVLGFITIPFGSFLTFAAIAGLMIMQMKSSKRTKKYDQFERLKPTIVATLLAVLVGIASLYVVVG